MQRERIAYCIECDAVFIGIDAENRAKEHGHIFVCGARYPDPQFVDHETLEDRVQSLRRFHRR